MTPQTIILVFLGGGIGAVARYVFGLASVSLLGAAFPWGTLGVNVIGSLVIGFLAQALPAAEMGGMSMRLFLMAGILGGFTTFSAFSLDVMHLVQKGEAGLAFGYIAASIALSLLAVFLGWSVGRLI